MKIIHPNSKDSMIVIGSLIAIEDNSENIGDQYRAERFECQFDPANEKLIKRNYRNAHLVALKDIDAYMAKAKYGVRAIETVHKALKDHHPDNENFDLIASLKPLNHFDLIASLKPLNHAATHAEEQALSKKIGKAYADVKPILSLAYKMLIEQNKGIATLTQNDYFVKKYDNDVVNIAFKAKITEKMAQNIAKYSDNEEAIFCLIERGFLKSLFEHTTHLSLLLAYARQGMIKEDMLDLDNLAQILEKYTQDVSERDYYDYATGVSYYANEIHQMIVAAYIPFLSEAQAQRLLSNKTLGKVDVMVNHYSGNFLSKHVGLSKGAITEADLIHAVILKALINNGYADAVEALDIDYRHGQVLNEAMIKAGKKSSLFLLSNSENVLMSLIERGYKDDLNALVNHRNSEIRCKVLQRDPSYYDLLKDDTDVKVVKVLFKIATQEQKQELIAHYIPYEYGHKVNKDIILELLPYVIETDTKGTYLNSIERFLTECDPLFYYNDDKIIVSKAIANPIYLPVLIALKNTSLVQELIDQGGARYKFAFSDDKYIAEYATKALAKDGQLPEALLAELKMLGKIDADFTLGTE